MLVRPAHEQQQHDARAAPHEGGYLEHLPEVGRGRMRLDARGVLRGTWLGLGLGSGSGLGLGLGLGLGSGSGLGVGLG